MCTLLSAFFLRPHSLISNSLIPQNEKLYCTQLYATFAVLVFCSEVLLTLAGTEAKGRWSSEEEEALRRAVNKFGSGSWKEIKENEPTLSNRSIFQLKDKVISLHSNFITEHLKLS